MALKAKNYQFGNISNSKLRALHKNWCFIAVLLFIFWLLFIDYQWF